VRQWVSRRFLNATPFPFPTGNGCVTSGRRAAGKRVSDAVPDNTGPDHNNK
jgi:hypothetical protein